MSFALASSQSSQEHTRVNQLAVSPVAMRVKAHCGDVLHDCEGSLRKHIFALDGILSGREGK